MIKIAQKTSNNNTWSLVTAQEDLKARMEEVTHLKEPMPNKTPDSEENLTTQLGQAR